MTAHLKSEKVSRHVADRLSDKHKKICVKSARSPTKMNRAKFPSIGSDGSMAGIQSDPLIDAGGRQGGQSIFQKSQARSNQSSSID